MAFCIDFNATVAYSIFYFCTLPLPWFNVMVASEAATALMLSTLLCPLATKFWTSCRDFWTALSSSKVLTCSFVTYVVSMASSKTAGRPIHKRWNPVTSISTKARRSLRFSNIWVPTVSLSCQYILAGCVEATSRIEFLAILWKTFMPPSKLR